MADEKGLKKLRAASGKEPTHHCGNCRCKRYSPCGCFKKAKKEDK